MVWSLKNRNKGIHKLSSSTSTSSNMKIMATTSTLLALFLVGTLLPSVVTGDDLDYTDFIPCLTDDSLDTSEIIACVVNATDQDCFDSTSISDIGTCVEDSAADSVSDKLEECTGEYVECVNSTLTDFIDDLPACFQESMSALAQCHIDNAETCSSSTYADLDFSDLTMLNLVTCNAIQGSIVDEVCGAASCCHSEWETALECAINSAYYTTCDFTCSDGGGDGRVRGLGAMSDPAPHHQYRHLDEFDPDAVFKKCAMYAPTIFGNGNPAEIVNRGGKYVECVASELGDLTEEVKKDAEAHEGDAEADEGDGGMVSKRGVDTDATTSATSTAAFSVSDPHSGVAVNTVLMFGIAAAYLML